MRPVIRRLAFVATMSLTVGVHAEVPVEIDSWIRTAKITASTCSLASQTAILAIQNGLNVSEAMQRSDNCIKDGKQTLRDLMAKIKAAWPKGKALGPELADWRLDWTTALDVSAIQPTDSRMSIARRFDAASATAERTSNKLLMSLE